MVTTEVSVKPSVPSTESLVTGAMQHCPGPNITGQMAAAPVYGLVIFDPKTQTSFRIPLNASQQTRFDALLVKLQAKHTDFTGLNIDDLIVDRGTAVDYLDSSDQELIKDVRQLVCDALGHDAMVFKRFSPDSPIAIGAPRAFNRYGSARLQEAQFTRKDLIEVLGKKDLTQDIALTDAQQMEIIRRTEAAKASRKFYEMLFKELEKHISQTMQTDPKYLSLMNNAQAAKAMVESLDYNAVLFEAASPLNIGSLKTEGERRVALERKRDRGEEWVGKNPPPKFAKADYPLLFKLAFARDTGREYDEIREIEKNYVNDLVLNNIDSRALLYEGRQVLGNGEKRAFAESFICRLNALIATGTDVQIQQYLQTPPFTLAFSMLDFKIQEKVRAAIETRALHLKKEIQGIIRPSIPTPPPKEGANAWLVAQFEQAAATLNPPDIQFT